MRSLRMRETAASVAATMAHAMLTGEKQLVANLTALIAAGGAKSRGHGGRHRVMQPQCDSRAMQNRSEWYPHSSHRQNARQAGHALGYCGKDALVAGALILTGVERHEVHALLELERRG